MVSGMDFVSQKELEKLIHKPVYLENDANLAALAEAIIGEGKEYNIVQYLTVSTGLEQDLLLIKKYSKELMDLRMKLPMYAYGIMDQVMEAFIQAA